MKKQYPILAATAYAFLVGLSFLTTKQVVPFAQPLLILAHRFTIAFAGFILFLKFSKQTVRLNWDIIKAILPMTLFYPLLFFTLQLYGLSTASSAEAGIIFATVPVMTIMIVALFGKRPSIPQIISVLLSVSGAAYIVGNNTTSAESSLTGLILLILSALSFAFYAVLIGKLLKKVSLHELTVVLILTGFVVFNLMYFIQAGNLSRSISLYIEPFKSMDYSLVVLYLGFFASVLASLFSNYALKHLSAPQFSVFSNLSTLISVFAGSWLLGENLHNYHFFGGTLILLGVIGTNFSQSIVKFKIIKKNRCYG